MTPDEALQFIHQRKWQGSKPGLSRTRELLGLMGKPQNRLRFIHIAGTNGKGSTSAILASVLSAAGLKTALYTSPYISRFNERMQINGMPISGEALAEITAKAEPLALSMEDRPTEFELVTAIALEFFAREGCDLVVLEAGLGGRLDSTNVIESPLVSVITNIGLDHTRELGDTTELIAAEKAGIIKPQCPVVIYDLPESVRKVIAHKCAEVGSPLVSANFADIKQISDGRDGQAFSYKGYSDIFLSLLGAHQLKNAAVALEVIAQLRTQGIAIPEAAVKTGFEHTRWPARFEILSQNPFFVLDGGHNPQCAETVADNLRRYFPDKKVIMLFGVLAGKNYAAMSEILAPTADCFVTITPEIHTALPAAELAAHLSRFNKPVYPCETIKDGIEKAMSLADENSVICAVGSLYSAGTIREYFGRNHK